MNDTIRKIWKSSFLVLLTVLLSLGSTNVFGAELRSHPLDGGSIVFYDIDSSGRILEVNYDKEKAKILTSLNLKELASPIFWQGWIMDDRHHVIFIRMGVKSKAPVKAGKK